MRRLAATDPLTGAANRRHFMEMVNKELGLYQRYHRQMTLAMIDIDHFKKVNDTYGHPVGDEVLQALVKHCHACLRNSDLIGRLGGEEFGFLLVETNLEDGKLVVVRLRQTISELRLPLENGELAFAVSIGVTNIQKEDGSLESIMKRADKALYNAKKQRTKSG